MFCTLIHQSMASSDLSARHVKKDKLPTKFACKPKNHLDALFHVVKHLGQCIYVLPVVCHKT